MYQLQKKPKEGVVLWTPMKMVGMGQMLSVGRPCCWLLTSMCFYIRGPGNYRAAHNYGMTGYLDNIS